MNNNLIEKPIVSIILPAYNAETYLEKAVDSMCSQTLTNWEMFIVDDGSTDGTGPMCDRLASDDSRIRVIHQENAGAPAARNAAIGLASGKYLYFMDADDWASSNMLYEMVCLAEHYFLDAWAGMPVNNNSRRMDSLGIGFQDPADLTANIPEDQCAQLVVAGYYIETYYSETEYYMQKQCASPKVFADRTEFRAAAHELFDKNLLYTPWNKLYLTSYIKDNNIRFPDTHWDDFPFNLDIIKNIDRVTVTDSAYYHFIRKRADSESERYNPELFEKREEEHQWLLGLYDGWKSEFQTMLLEEMKTRKPSIALAGERQEDIQQEKADKENAASGPSAQTQDTHTDKESREIKKDGKETASVTKDDDAERNDDKKSEANKTNSDAIKEKSGKEETETQKECEIKDHFGTYVKVEPKVKVEEAPIVTVVDETEDVTPRVNIPPEAQEFISRRYVERIVGCIENITNPACTLSDKEKKEEIAKIINKDSVKEALKIARPKSLYMKAMLLPIKMKSTGLTFLEGKLISKTKSGNKKLFAKLKDNR